jgi:hypothetical protein
MAHSNNCYMLCGVIVIPWGASFCTCLQAHMPCLYLPQPPSNAVPPPNVLPPNALFRTLSVQRSRQNIICLPQIMLSPTHVPSRLFASGFPFRASHTYTSHPAILLPTPRTRVALVLVRGAPTGEKSSVNSDINARPRFSPRRSGMMSALWCPRPAIRGVAVLRPL